MIRCQDSPVEQRMRRRKDVVKSRKFTCSFNSSRGSPILDMPNIARPMIANMKKRMMSRRPSEPSEGAESRRVRKMICSF